jgi:hypothetical protein
MKGLLLTSAEVDNFFGRREQIDASLSTFLQFVEV